MGRKLIVFADGTGNSAESTTKTNVWRLYEALDLTRDDQIAVFDDGVGTQSFKPLRYLGLVFGVGLKRNVLDLYKFLCRNYNANGRTDDEVHAFGFSRGAFTIRVLAALIDHQGIVRYDSDEQLDRDAQSVYRAYRSDSRSACASNELNNGSAQADGHDCRSNRRTKNDRPATMVVTGVVLGALLGAIDWTKRKLMGAGALEPLEKRLKRKPTIKFAGLWDTVAAYGLPIDELTRAVDRWVWPMSLPDTNLPAIVENARHALSLDDDRRTFHPIPWPETARPRRYDQSIKAERKVQVWFAGVHANVGGGYPDDRLAHIPLCWMIEQAQHFGLRFKDELVRHYRAVASDDGRQYDSRAGAGNLYRYHPRSLTLQMAITKPEPKIPDGGPSNWRVPLVHHSVITRMASGFDNYASVAIDCNIDILDTGGIPRRFQNTNPVGASDAQLAINKLLDSGNKPEFNREKREANLESALDLVWWRRALYYLMLMLSLALVLLPVVKAALVALEQYDPLAESVTSANSHESPHFNSA
ncbi:MAG: DUF2235 domain-containing protein [Alphaproteobacteria bacterium]|nr:DUF2235 domain-containing protein [Alphaproteobacteria bacterium]